MIDCPAARTCHAIGMPDGVEPGGELRDAAGTVEVMLDVLFARPEQLHRLADLLGDQHRLPDVVLHTPRRPKPPPSIILWTSTLLGGTPAALAAAAQRGFGVLRRAPRPRPGPPVTWAVQFCGSIVACARNGT